MTDQDTKKTGVNDDLAAGDNNDDQGDNSGDEKMVPLSVVESIRNELKEIKGSNQELQSELQLYRYNQNQSRQDQTSKKDPGFGDLEDDDVLTVADAKRLVEMERQRTTASLGEMRIRSANSDYDEVITKHLPNVLKENPQIAEAIRTSSDPYTLAYTLGKTDPEYLKSKNASKQDADAKKILENADKPGNVGSAGGGGGGLSKVDQVLALNDDELEKRIARVKSGL